MNFGDGWFNNFKQWWGSRKFKAQIESSRPVQVEIEKASLDLEKRNEGFNSYNVLNVDEFVIFSQTRIQCHSSPKTSHGP